MYPSMPLLVNPIYRGISSLTRAFGGPPLAWRAAESSALSMDDDASLRSLERTFVAPLCWFLIILMISSLVPYASILDDLHGELG
jgi:hypothetical protein